jgi:UDP-N-acetyl-D-glucosamine dehydrogenase
MGVKEGVELGSIADVDPGLSFGLRRKILSRGAVIGILGLGYVGLPLLQAFLTSGFSLVGFDISESRIRQIASGEISEPGIDSSIFVDDAFAGNLELSWEEECLSRADVFIICVPTPVTRNLVPDTSYISRACDAIRAHLGSGTEHLVILESTSYPGTTDILLRGSLEGESIVLGENLYVAFSPERIDPGNKSYGIRNTPKLVGGSTARCGEMARALYSSIVDNVVAVSSPAVAEMAKIFENTYRAVNIALANEFAMLCHRMDLNVWEVLEAAKTKPFGISVFYPGAGVGGHCIPCDPFYLSWRAQEFDMPMHFIELAGEINRRMPHFVVERVVHLLGERKLAIQGARVGLVGLAYKPDIGDLREAPALRIAELISVRGGLVSYHDPFVESVDDPEGHWFENRCSTPLEELLEGCDCLVIVTRHSPVDYVLLARSKVPVLDCVNSLSALDGRENVVAL